MKVSMKHKKSKNKKIDIIANPINFSISKIRYKKISSTLGEDTSKVLKKFLNLSSDDLKKYRKKNYLITLLKIVLKSLLFGFSD